MLYINYIKGPREKNLKKSLFCKKNLKKSLLFHVVPVCSIFAAYDPTSVTKGWEPVAVHLQHLIQHVSQSRVGASCGIFAPSDPTCVTWLR